MTKKDEDFTELRSAEKPSPLKRLGEAMVDMQPPEWIVEGLLPRGAFVMLAGEAKVARKTTLATHLSICLAKGEPFLGLPTKKCRVAMLNLEDGYQTMLGRYYDFGIRAGDELPIDLLVDENRLFDALDVVRKEKPDVVIIDPLMEVEILFGVKSENASIEMATVLKELRRLARELNILVVVMHHAGAKSELRGSTTLKGSTDGWFVLSWIKKLGVRRLKWWLRRAPEGHVDLSIQYTETGIDVDCVTAPVFGDTGDGGAEGSSDEDDGGGINQDSYTRICTVLQKAIGPMSQNEIREAARVRKKDLPDILAMLLNDGLVETSTVGRMKQWSWKRDEATSPLVSDGDLF